jgi:Flp pilus assembly pilin Flp
MFEGYKTTGSFTALLASLHREQKGQDLIEYSLIGLIVATGAIAGMGSLASSINSMYTRVASQLT